MAAKLTRGALGALLGLSLGVAACGGRPAEPELQALAEQAADDHVDAVVAYGYPAWEDTVFALRETVLRGAYDGLQYPCLQGKPTYYDVQEVRFDGPRAEVVADRNGRPASFWLTLEEGRFLWLPGTGELSDIRAGKPVCG